MKNEYTMLKIKKFRARDGQPVCRSERKITDKNNCNICVFFDSTINILNKHCRMCPPVKNWDVYGDKEILVPKKLLKLCPIWKDCYENN